MNELEKICLDCKFCNWDYLDEKKFWCRKRKMRVDPQNWCDKWKGDDHAKDN